MEKLFCRRCGKALVGGDLWYVDSAIKDLKGMCRDCALTRSEEILEESREKYSYDD